MGGSGSRAIGGGQGVAGAVVTQPGAQQAVDILALHREELLGLLGRFIPGVAVWAFGSRVRGTAQPYSDLDLAVFTTPAQSLLVSDLRDALAESNLPFVVDLHVWGELPPDFQSVIGQQHEVLQGAGGEWQSSPPSVTPAKAGIQFKPKSKGF